MEDLEEDWLRPNLYWGGSHNSINYVIQNNIPKNDLHIHPQLQMQYQPHRMRLWCNVSLLCAFTVPRRKHTLQEEHSFLTGSEIGL